MKINSIAIVEYIHDFVLTYAALLPFMEPRPRDAMFGVEIRGVLSDPDEMFFLPPYGVRSIGWQIPHEAVPPDLDDYEWHDIIRLGEPVEVGQISLRIVERVYAFFKRTFEEIPYLNDDRTGVDPTTFGA